MSSSPLLGRRRDGLRIVQPGTDEPLPVGPTDPTNLTIVGSATGTDYDGAYGLAYDNGLCYTTAVMPTPDKFTITDVSDPANPVKVGQTTLTSGRSIAFGSGHCYVTGITDDTVDVLDVSTPSSPTVVGSVTDATILNGPDHIVYRDGFCYISCPEGDTATIVDVADPTTPVIRGHVRDTNILLDPIGVDHSGYYFYVVGYSNSSLVTIDASDPDAPTILGSITDPIIDFPRAVDVHDGICYVACHNNAFVVVDGTDPSNPTIIGSLTDARLEGAYSISLVQGGIAYVGTQLSDRVLSVDVSDPTNPAIVSSIAGIDGRRMTVSDGTVYIADFANDSIRIIQ